MTQETLPFDRKRARKPTLTDRLYEYLSARQGQWIDVVEMARLVGVSGVRQRRLECEQRGIVLEARTRVDDYGLHHREFRVVSVRRAA